MLASLESCVRIVTIGTIDEICTLEFPIAAIGRDPGSIGR